MAQPKQDDDERAHRLRKQAALHPDWAPILLKLANKLDPSKTSPRRRVPRTLSSRRYMRKYRIRISGALWHLHDQYGASGRTFTLMPAGMTYAPDQLAGVNPGKLIERARSALNRAGATEAADGFLFLAVDGEYDALTGLFHLHLHGYAQGAMLAVVNRLREQQSYKRQLLGQGSPGRTTPVRIDRQPLTNLPAPFTYLVKSFWLSRLRALGGTGKRGKPRPQRIPEPAHSQWLLWMDRWRLEDMILMMRLRVVNGRLTPR